MTDIANEECNSRRDVAPENLKQLSLFSTWEKGSGMRAQDVNRTLTAVLAAKISCRKPFPRARFEKSEGSASPP
jgi:hypothetical protein